MAEMKQVSEDGTNTAAVNELREHMNGGKNITNDT